MNTDMSDRRRKVIKWIKIVLITINLFSLEFLSAQNYATLDTVYTPPGFELGELMATINIPNDPKGVGVIVTHGAYPQGPFQRHTMQIWCDTLAANGYLAMTIDYYSLDVTAGSLDTNTAYPRQATTFKLAVEFLRKNADLFNIYTGQIVGFGMSGGAYHWGQSVIWDNDDSFFQTDSTIDDHLDAGILLYGFYDNYNYNPSWLIQIIENHFSLNPEFRATKGNCIANVANITTPILTIHGTADQNVYYQQSVQLHDSLLAIGKSSELLLFEGLEHGFDLTDYFPPHSFTDAGLIAKDTILAYLSRILQWPVSIGELQNSNKRHFMLRNYPNPFSTSTTIEYELRQPTNVVVNIFNQHGQQINKIDQVNLQSGKQKYVLDASNLPNGLYFVQLRAGQEISSLKILKMR